MFCRVLRQNIFMHRTETGLRIPVRPWRTALIGSVAIGVTMGLAGVSAASAPGNTARGAAARQQTQTRFLHTHDGSQFNSKATASPADAGIHGGDDDLADGLAQYNTERTAPAGYVTGPALATASQSASALPRTKGSWQEFTTQPYNAQPSDYTDPFWSNVGAGWADVGGRTTALVTAPDGDWFAGTADGGVWRSADQGQHWTPVFDGMPSMSIGALAIDPVTGALWVGTGEANQSSDSYAGTGVYVSTDNGQSFQSVGAVNGVSPLASRTIFRISFDPAGDAYAATDNGLFRFDAGTRQWTEVLDPAGTTDNPPYDQQVTDVAVVPGSHGKDVIAAIGWHGPGNTANNGFYESSDSGKTFSKVTPSGDVNASDIGRTTFAYSADGSKLYAVVQSVSAEAAGAESVLQGIFVTSGTGGKAASVAGPWTKIADEAKLAASGSANKVGSGYGVGIQAWYNQDLAVDPANPDHVYAGLEEVFESTDAGSSWVTASPYWNYGLACGTSCPNGTHPDQHAMMIADAKIVIGNDGGVYSRPLSDTQQYGDWTDLNATLRSWQYYDARAGALPGGNTGVAGGLQDNGSSIDTTSNTQMDEASGGDGFYVTVDPANANNWAGEYTYGAVYTTTDGGHTFGDDASVTCSGQTTVGLTPRADCDPNPRFATPLVQDPGSPKVWLTGGEYVWESANGWNTSCTDTACDWKQLYDLGTGNATTALSSAQGGKVVYAAWVANGGNPGAAFARGIATNYGGTWHQLSLTGLPNRYISGVTVDPSDPAHAYAVFNGYSRRWIPGGGTGHVFETTDGGRSWTDISGNLPDIPSDALVLSHGQLVLATDNGVYTAAQGKGAGTSWSVLGSGLPDTSVNDLTVGPGGYIYAATHGRGVWRFRF